MDALSADLGVHHDETAADGSITLEHAECLAACDYAPVVTVDYEFYDQQDVDSARELVAALRRGEAQDSEFRRLTKDGRAVWIRASYNPVVDGRGRVVEIVKFALDVTAEKLASAFAAVL